MFHRGRRKRRQKETKKWVESMSKGGVIFEKVGESMKKEAKLSQCLSPQS